MLKEFAAKCHIDQPTLIFKSPENFVYRSVSLTTENTSISPKSPQDEFVIAYSIEITSTADTTVPSLLEWMTCSGEFHCRVSASSAVQTNCNHSIFATNFDNDHDLQLNFNFRHPQSILEVLWYIPKDWASKSWIKVTCYATLRCLITNHSEEEEQSYQVCYSSLDKDPDSRPLLPSDVSPATGNNKDTAIRSVIQDGDTNHLIPAKGNSLEEQNTVVLLTQTDNSWIISGSDTYILNFAKGQQLAFDITLVRNRKPAHSIHSQAPQLGFAATSQNHRAPVVVCMIPR